MSDEITEASVNGFGQSLIQDVYAKSCHANVILIHVHLPSLNALISLALPLFTPMNLEILTEQRPEKLVHGTPSI